MISARRNILIILVFLLNMFNCISYFYAYFFSVRHCLFGVFELVYELALHIPLLLSLDSWDLEYQVLERT